MQALPSCDWQAVVGLSGVMGETESAGVLIEGHKPFAERYGQGPKCGAAPYGDCPRARHAVHIAESRERISRLRGVDDGGVLGGPANRDGVLKSADGVLGRGRRVRAGEHPPQERAPCKNQDEGESKVHTSRHREREVGPRESV